MASYRFLTLPTALAALLIPTIASMAAPAPKSTPRPAVVPVVNTTPQQVAAVPVAETTKALASLPAPAPATVVAAPPATDDYTGILIDARGLPDILRSPAPAIYGPAPETSLLYPNRSDVPTPDEVQDESIVRYYHSENEAEAGVAGSHPLILKALAVLGPAHDALQLSAADMASLQALDKELHFSHTWKVGFLIPAGQ